MKLFSKSAGALIAASTILFASPAAAQQVAELDPEAVSAAVRYSLPHAFDGFMKVCSNDLVSNGYAATNADRLRAKFADGADASWPGAKALMLQMAEREAGEATSILSFLDDDDLQPLVAGIVTTLTAEELRGEDCAQIEQGMEILDPLPAENVAQLVGFLVAITNEDEGGLISQNSSESRERKLREQEREQ